MKYNITIVNNGREIKLPTARTIVVGTEGGYVNSFYIYLPVENLTFDEAMVLANQIADQFKYAGGKRTYFPKEPITQHTIAENLGMDLNSIWQVPLKGLHATSYYECWVEIRSSQSFKGSTLPPLAALVTSDRSKNPYYMIMADIKVSDEVLDELSNLDSARVIYNTGNINGSIPFIEYYNDPNWRPVGWDGKYV